MSQAYVIEKFELDRDAKVVVASGAVAQASDIWRHHFPGFAVLPGVLMLDLLKKTAEKWYGCDSIMLSVRRVRFSNYLKPGAHWQSRMRFSSSSPEGDAWSGEILSEEIKVASAVLTLKV